MPPQRPLPDLCLISVFKMLTPNEQLKASEMSPRCAVLVRAANRTVKKLIITTRNYIYGELPNLKKTIYSFSEPIMRLLVDISGETYPGYPMTARLSKWNILRLDQLRLIDAVTIHQIVTIFSAVTDLEFISSKHIDTLVSLLQLPNWQCQLTNLLVDETRVMDSRLARELITAINGLTALQLLYLDWDNFTEIPDLPILAQLKTMAFNSDNPAFLRSLERNAIDNAGLQVYLLSYNNNTLLTLSQPLHNRIFRYGRKFLDYTRDQVPLLCSQFRFLTSMEIMTIESTKVGQLFSHLSQLHQLIHLMISVDFSEVKQKLPPPSRPQAQLNSVRALELYLRITSHSQIEWLNLQWTMPNLKIIYIWKFKCRSCKVRDMDYNSDSPSFNSSAAFSCFRSSFFNLHPGVPLKQIVLDLGAEFQSAEELLLQNP